MLRVGEIKVDTANYFVINSELDTPFNIQTEYKLLQAYNNSSNCTYI